ncbi:hypothetical protein [Nonomuraea sp. NPDC052265]|uniref:hypothetical protein n=1 Tax=Nonomuraea sp. NPDC052265 TaxID=3364374 RepID=UPI0037CC55D7
MTAAAPSLIRARPAGTSGVERLWGTPVVIQALDLAGILKPGVAAPGPEGEPFEVISTDAVLADEDALRTRLLASMAALAAGQGLPEPSGLQLEIQAWRGGFDKPAFSVGAEAIAWCVLTASEPLNQESGAIALTDPRPGGPQTAMPGLPWGRQFVIRCATGAHAAAPGWLTCSVVPLEQGQSALVAVATSLR